MKSNTKKRLIAFMLCMVLGKYVIIRTLTF